MTDGEKYLADLIENLSLQGGSMSFSIEFNAPVVDVETDEDGDEGDEDEIPMLNGASTQSQARDILLAGLRERLSIPFEEDTPEKVFVWLDRRLAERQLDLNSLQALERAVRETFGFSADADVDTMIRVLKKSKPTLVQWKQT